jgi:hypothetical protein
MASHIDIILLTAGYIVYVVGLSFVWKRGTWLGDYITFSGVLLVIIATLVKMLSS